MPLPGLDGGRPIGSGTFSPAARLPVGGADRARSTGPRGLFGRGCARRAVVEHGRRRGGAAAVSGHRCSRRRAGEHGQVRRARAPGEGEEVIPVPSLAGERVEVGRRR
jgi:hypothetical protein